MKICFNSVFIFYSTKSSLNNSDLALSEDEDCEIRSFKPARRHDKNSDNNLESKNNSNNNKQPSNLASNNNSSHLKNPQLDKTLIRKPFIENNNTVSSSNNKSPELNERKKQENDQKPAELKTDNKPYSSSSAAEFFKTKNFF